MNKKTYCINFMLEELLQHTLKIFVNIHNIKAIKIVSKNNNSVNLAEILTNYYL